MGCLLQNLLEWTHDDSEPDGAEPAGRTREAQVQLETALQIDPNHELARENLAMLKQQPKNHSSAR